MILSQAVSPPFSSVLDAVNNGDHRLKVGGLSKSSEAFFLASLARSGHSFCLVAASYEKGQRLFQEIAFFLKMAQKKPLPSLETLFFPPWDTLPYEPSDPRPDRIAQRLETLQQMARKTPVCVVTSVEAFLQRVVSKSFLLDRSFKLTIGESYLRDALIKRISGVGYERTETVTLPGEIALRGGIIDLFTPLSDRPVRIEFFGDEIESIRLFDPETQRSEKEIEEVEIMPGREDLLDTRYHQVSFSDYLPSNALLILDEPDTLIQNGKRFLEEAEEGSLFALRRNPKYPKFSKLYLPFSHLIDAGLGRTTIDLEGLLQRPEKGVKRFTINVKPLSSLGLGQQGQTFSDSSKVLNRLRQNHLVLLVTKNKYQMERFRRLFGDHDIPCSDWPASSGANAVSQPIKLPAPVFLTVGILSESFSFSGSELVFLTGEALTGVGHSARHPASATSKKKTSKEKRSGFFSSFEELKPSDYVVHVDHGIGRYVGLKRLLVRQQERELGYETDFIVVEYAGKDKVYVPLDSLNLLQRYVGLEGGAPKIDKLGGSRWGKVKAKVRGQIKEMTHELLELYAKRAVLEGHPFSVPRAESEAFEAAFEFDETPDQIRTIREVTDDMEKAKPMDRLVCGDVGFGKTEVAMRAAFQAVMNNKQVAMIVPTTLLAQQHYQTFSDRFTPFPINVAVLSRFLSRREQREVLAKLKAGLVDILIGTHRLLQKDVEFRDLGLIVVDEEHRFGVRHKEWMKQMRKEVDVLTLTATPIPRTLQMALAQVRDLSVIETPPADRLAIRTIMAPFDPSIIREAVFRELVRGGQVFFLHNRVRNIEQFGNFLAELLPEARIGIAHGQMREAALEKVMLKFLNKEYNLLLTTTIIESGIDIPSANTIIINDADRFGLSELYQLRGRVGRSGDQAYAYLLVREGRILTEEARKRLHAIQEFSELGSGFKIAARDLEIRGAGNLLGQEQSGQIAAIGFELYLEMIDELVQELQGKEVKKELEPTLQFKISSYLPEEYISDSYQRLSIYKQLSSCADLSDIDAIRYGLEDRYGPLPEPVQQLLQVIQLKGMARHLHIINLKEHGDCIRFSFDPSVELAKLDLNALLEKREGKIQFISPFSFELSIPSDRWEDIYLETALCLKLLHKGIS